MKQTALKQWLLLSSQLFLLALIPFLSDLAYRWDSMTHGMRGIEPWNMIAIVIVPLAIFMLLASGLVSFLTFGLGKAHQKIASCIVLGVQLVLVFIFIVPQFTTLAQWSESILLDTEILIGGRWIALVVAAVLAVFYTAIHWIWFRACPKNIETPRLLGGFIFTFSILIIECILLYIMLENHPKAIILFKTYGIFLFWIYAIVYWRQLLAIMQRSRIFLAPAGALVAVSIVLIGSTLIFSKPVPVIALDEPDELVSSHDDVENIILITLDGLPTKNMALYGGEHKISPNIDTFAEESYVFSGMRAEADATAQSLPALHTGMHYPGDRLVDWGVDEAGGNFMGYMPQVFESIGWDTRYEIFARDRGVRDFDYYLSAYNGAPDDLMNHFYGDKLMRSLVSFSLTYPPIPTVWLEWVYAETLGPYKSAWFPLEGMEFPFEQYERPGANKLMHAQEYLEDREGEDGVFMWVHLWPPHPPFYRIEPYKGEFLEDESLAYNQVYDLFRAPPINPDYQDEARQLELMFEEFMLATDAEVGLFLDYLEDAGWLDSSMVIMTSDHGMAFEKQDLLYVTRVMYEQTMSIPLIIHMPGQEEQKWVEGTVHHTDIMPTILETIGAATPNWMDGTSLWSYADDELSSELDSRVVISQALPSYFAHFPSDIYKHVHAFVAYRNDYKLIYRYYGDDNFEEIPIASEAETFFNAFPQVELFNLALDPEEMHNIAEDEPEIFKELMLEIEAHIEGLKAQRE